MGIPESQAASDTDSLELTLDEIVEAYEGMDLQPDELRAQHMLALSWGEGKLQEAGLELGERMFRLARRMVQLGGTDALDIILAMDGFQIAVDLLWETIETEMNGFKRIENPYAFFFIYGIWCLLRGRRESRTASRPPLPKSLDEVGGEPVEFSDMSSEMKAAYPHLASSGNFAPIRICVFPGCGNPETAIEAHSISKSNFLKPFANPDSKLWHVEYPPQPYPERTCWDTITAGEASRFTGLCIEHDSIFQPLDKSSSSECLESLELKTLMAARTSLYGYWQKLEVDYRSPVSSWYVLLVYGMRIMQGLRNSSGLWKANRPYAVPRDRLRQLRNDCLRIVEEEAWDEMEHRIFTFRGVSPRVVSSGVSAVYAEQGTLAPAFVNIFPTDEGMVAVISYIKKDGDRLDDRLNWLKQQPVVAQKKQLTWMGMYHWYNTFFTEGYYDSLHQKQKDRILELSMFHSWLPQDYVNEDGTPFKFRSTRFYEMMNFSFFG